MSRKDDIWYAVKITRVVMPPRQTLETFGATTIRYHLISELMDEVDKVRVRAGKVFSERPQIITPDHFARQLLEGFGEKARDYAEWLSDHGEMVNILKYGLQFRKKHTSAEILSEPLNHVADKIKAAVSSEDDPLSAVIIGADELWEVSLLKFLRDYIEKSAPVNIQQLRQRDHEADLEIPREIEMEFRAAALDKKRIPGLGKKLQKYGLFEKYEDRFYALVHQR